MNIGQELNFNWVSKYRTLLMGVAILGVLMGHWYVLSGVTFSPAIESVYKRFVNLVFTQGFLFLSGFGLYFSLQKNASLKEFYTRRFYRLLLPFALISTPYFIFETIIEHQSVISFFGHITTISYWFEGNYSGMWYIAGSVVLYLLYPFIHRLLYCNKKFLKVALRFAISCIVFIGINELLKGNLNAYWSSHQHFFSQSWMLIVGSYFAYVTDNQYVIRGGVFLLSIFVITYLFKTMLLDGYAYFYSMMKVVIYIPSLCLFFRLTEMNPCTNYVNRLFSWLGKYTLELYILHSLYYDFIGYFTEVLSISRFAHITFAIILALATCTYTHNVIEMIVSKSQ